MIKKALFVFFVLSIFLIGGCNKTESRRSCDDIENQSHKDSCYLVSAYEYLDLSLCEKISDPSEIRDCEYHYYWFLAIEEQNVTICENIDDDSFIDFCYGDLGVILKDRDICDKVKDDLGRNHCHDEIGDLCNEMCRDEGFLTGTCLSTGSATSSVHCDDLKGTNIHSIIDEEVPGCGFDAIGSWDECCCFG
jgi:hypothetical protein